MMTSDKEVKYLVKKEGSLKLFPMESIPELIIVTANSWLPHNSKIERIYRLEVDMKTGEVRLVELEPFIEDNQLYFKEV